MLIKNTVKMIFLLFSGLVAGILIGYLASRPARSTLSPSSFVQYQQIVHTYYQPMMQVLMLGAILVGIVWLIMLRREVRSASFAFAASAVIGTVAIAVITISVNVPINEQLMAWNSISPPADLQTTWSRWESAHVVRTIVAVLAFTCAVIASTWQTKHGI